MAAAVEAAYKESFERVESGAALSYPCQASQLRVNGFVLIKDEPCKIVSINISKTGKHGGAKMHLVALHIFSGKKVDALFMSTDNCEVPYVERKDYQLVDIGRDGYLALYDEGTPKHDLCLGSSKVDTELRAAFEEGIDLLVTVQKSMGIEGVFSFKEERAS